MAKKKNNDIWNKIKKEWPALKALGNPYFNADPNFDLRPYGYGAIEHQADWQDTTRYGTLKGYPDFPKDKWLANPAYGTGEHSITYNPNLNSLLDIKLDLLHGMHSDPKYKKHWNAFRDAYKDTKYVHDIKNWWEKEGKVNSYEDYEKNYIDGQIRGMLGQGAPKGKEVADYAQEYWDNPKLKESATTIKNYLETGFENLLPEVTVSPRKYKHGGPHNSPTKYELIAERTKDKLMQYDPEGNSYFSVHPSGSGPTFQSMYPDLANEFNIQGQGKNLQIPYSNKSILDSKNISSIPNAQSLKIKESQIPEPPKNLPFKVNKPKLQSKRIKAVVNTGNIDDSKYDGNKYTDVSFYEYDPNTGKKELVGDWKDDFKDAMAQPMVEFTSPSGTFIRGGIEEVMDSLYNADINNIKYDQLPTAIKYKNVPPAHTEGIERELKYGGDTTPDRQQQLKDFQSFYGNYINSPKYRERLESSGYEDIDNIIKTRSDALNNIQMNVDPGFTRNFMTSFEYSSPTEKPPQMQVSELFPREDEFGITQFMPQERLDYTIAHEAGHATDAYGVGLNPRDRMALEDYNQLYRNAPFTGSKGLKEGTINFFNKAQTTVRKISDDKPKYWDNFGVKEGALHDIGSAESYADLVATRKYLFDNYNLSPENDITEEQWKNISKSFDPTNSDRGDSNLSIKRFFEKYKKPVDATYILNNVAMESPKTGEAVNAKYGGQMKQYKKGGKRGLWDNIHAKRERIKAGSNETMREPGSKGAPTNKAFKNSQATYGGMLPEYGVGGFLKGALSGVAGSVPIVGGMMQKAIGVDPDDKSAQAGQILGGIGSLIFNPVGAVGSALKGAKAAKAVTDVAGTATDIASTAKNTTGLLGGFKNLFSNGSANLDMIAQAGGEFMPEVDYEAEGGEVIVGDVKVNRAYNGGTMKSYKGGGMHLLSGPKHSAGGIGIMQFGGDSSYVFSDSKDLKVPKEFGKFNTFADAAKSRSKSLEDIAEMQMGGEIYDRKTADLMKPLAMQEFSNLFNAQEQFKADNGIDNPVRSAQNGGVQFGQPSLSSTMSPYNIFQPEETGAYMKANTDVGGNPFAQFITSQNKEREINVPISSYAANQGFNRDKNIDLEAFKAGILGPEGGRDMDYSMQNAQGASSYGPYQISYPAHKKALLEKYGVENEAELAYGTVGRLGVDGMTADEIQEDYMNSLVGGYETGANNYYDSLSDVEKKDLQRAGIGKSEYMSIAHFRGNQGAKDYAGSVTTQMAAGVPYNPKAAFGNYAENPGAPIGYDEQANPIYSGNNANNMLAGDYAQRFGKDYDANLQSRGLSRYDINSPDGLDMFGGARQESPISLDPIKPQPLDVPSQEPTMGQFRPQSSVGLTPMPVDVPNSNQSLRTQSGREYQTSPTVTSRGLPGGIPNIAASNTPQPFRPYSNQVPMQDFGVGDGMSTSRLNPNGDPEINLSQLGRPTEYPITLDSIGLQSIPIPEQNLQLRRRDPIAATASNDGSGSINPAWMQTIQNRMGITANADGSPVSTTDPLAAIGAPEAEGQEDSAKLPWQLYAANAIPGLMNIGKGLFGTAPTMELEREQNQAYRNFNPIMNNYSQMQGRGLALGRAGLQGSGATGAQLRGGYQAMNSGAQAQAGQFMNQLSPQIEQSRRATDRFNQGVMSRNQQRTLMEDQFAMQNDPANSLSKGIGQLVDSGTNLYMDNLKAQNIGTQMYDMFGKFIGNKDS